MPQLMWLHEAMRTAERIRQESVLPRRQAQVYVLRSEPYELSHAEVALVMPFGRSTASEYARRARRRIRRAQWTVDELALPI